MDRPRTPRRSAPRLVSVVMPVRNGAATNSEQLAALATQDYDGARELIVVDDASTDGTAELLEKARAGFPWPMRIITVASPGGSAASTRNRGIAAAAGDLVAFCDADDVVRPNWLGALATAAAAGDLVAGALDPITLNSPTVRAWQEAPRWLRSGQRFGHVLSTANCAGWADVLASLGGFDDTYHPAEDKGLTWHARVTGYRLVEAPRAVVAYRFRKSLRATARQRYRWGAAEVRLFRDFAANGQQRAAPAEVIRAWAWTVVNLPLLPFSARRRGRWTVRAAHQAGRLVGSVKEGVLWL
jgi:glycosyltransferase involved in cell wall biosynthesis